MQVSNKTFNLQQNYLSRTPPPEIRPIEPYNRLLEKYYWVITTKKEKSFRTSLLVPYDILFSNKYLRDLGRIWELREIVPDPNNMPWIEKIDK